MNTGKKFEQRFFYFTIYFFTLFSSYEGANNNSSVKFSCRFFVDFDVFQISLMFLVILFRASSCSGQCTRKCSTDSGAVPHSQTALTVVPVRWLSALNIVSCNSIYNGILMDLRMPYWRVWLKWLKRNIQLHQASRGLCETAALSRTFGPTSAPLTSPVTSSARSELL